MTTLGDRISDDQPAKQKAFILEIVKILNNPIEASQLPFEYILEASEYIGKLEGKLEGKSEGKYTINEESKFKIYNALMPKIPRVPPGYKSNRTEQHTFLNNIRPTFSSTYNLAIIPDNDLKEAMYYAESLGNSNALVQLTKESFRRNPIPFRPPNSSRPNRPYQSDIPITDFLNNLLYKIYSVYTTPFEKADAYHTFIEVFLTDWVNRTGYNKNGMHYIYTPLFDDARFLTDLEGHIEKILKTQILESPNPSSIKKLPGNSLRQQYLKDILERIQQRIKLLWNESFNKLTKLEREKKKKNKYKKRWE